MEENKMIYVVSVGYNRFTFDGPDKSEAAIGFAEMAKKHYIDWHGADKDETIEVEIKVIFQSELPKKEEE